MNKIPLRCCGEYAEERVNVSTLTIENYISTDNMLPNRRGITTAENLPNIATTPGFIENDILLSNIRPYFKKIWYSNFIGGCSSDVLVFRTNKDFDSKFLYYALSQDHFFDYMMAGSKGSKMPRGDKNHIKEYLIPNYSIEKQREISSYLSKIDEKIEVNNKIILNLEHLTKKIFNYWFIQFEFPNEEGKPYKSLGGKMIWNEELKQEIPEGWEYGALCKIYDIFDSQRIPLSNNERKLKKGIYPYYGATEIMDFIDEYIFDGTYVLLAEDGSVINAEGNPILQYVTGKFWVNNHAHVLKGANGYSNELLYMILGNISVNKIMTGSIQKKINQSNLNNYLIPYIPLSLAEKFDLYVKKYFEEKLVLNKNNMELIKLKEWLLPMLMNGQVTFK